MNYFLSIAKANGVTDPEAFAERMSRAVDDLASFHNASPDLVTEALEEALLGDTEWAKQFSIAVTADSAEARGAQILSQLGAADGDFQRSLDYQ